MVMDGHVVRRKALQLAQNPGGRPGILDAQVELPRRGVSLDGLDKHFAPVGGRPGSDVPELAWRGQPHQNLYPVHAGVNTEAFHWVTRHHVSALRSVDFCQDFPGVVVNTFIGG